VPRAYASRGAYCLIDRVKISPRKLLPRPRARRDAHTRHFAIMRRRAAIYASSATHADAASAMPPLDAVMA